MATLGQIEQYEESMSDFTKYMALGRLFFKANDVAQDK